MAEAEPYLRKLLRSPTVLQDPTHYHEVHASLYLAAALSTPSTDSNSVKLSEALLLFTRYFAIYDMQSREASSSVILPSLPRLPNALGLSVPAQSRVCHRVLPAKTELWARASFASLLQRLGLDHEAARQAEHMRYVYKTLCDVSRRTNQSLCQVSLFNRIPTHCLQRSTGRSCWTWPPTSRWS